MDILTKLETTTDGGLVYVSYALDMPGCMGQGQTPEEARANLKTARDDMLKNWLESIGYEEKSLIQESQNELV